MAIKGRMREEKECEVTTFEAEMVILWGDRVTRTTDEYKAKKWRWCTRRRERLLELMDSRGKRETRFQEAKISLK